MTDANYRPGIKAVIISVLVIGSIAIGALTFTRYFEYKEVEVTTGYSPQAMKEHLLAAKKYLAGLDYQVETIEGFDFFGDLPPSDHTILLKTLPAELPESYYNALANWIKSGGHLIAGVDFGIDEAGTASDFLSGFNLYVDYNEWWEDDNFDSDLATFTMPGDTEPFAINADVTFPIYLDDPDNITFSIPYEDEDYLLVQIIAESGHLTLTSDTGIFSNWSIGENDHALLLSRIVESTDSKTIWINDNFNGFKRLFSLIWENYKWVVLLLAALLLLWLRQASVRLGPLENFPDTQSNNFAQHLLAVARFHFRHNNTETLLAPTRDKIIKSLIAGKPGSDEEVVKQIASRSKLPQTQVQQALFGKASNSTTLTAATATLKQLTALTRQRH